MYHGVIEVPNKRQACSWCRFGILSAQNGSRFQVQLVSEKVVAILECYINTPTVTYIIYRVMVLYRLSKTCYFDFFVVLPHPFSYFITHIPYYFHTFCRIISSFCYYFHSFNRITSHFNSYYFHSLGLKNWAHSRPSRILKACDRSRANLCAEVTPRVRHVTSQ